MPGSRLVRWPAFHSGTTCTSIIGGEIRYTFLQNDMKLESGSAKATFGAQAHAIHYDLPDSCDRP